MNWRDAFLAQARSDYEIFEKLNTPENPVCHKLHYLQMAMEKLAKGFLCKGDNPPPKRSHYVLVGFLQISKHRPEWIRLLGYAGKDRVYASIVDSLLPVADKIERLAPGESDRMNPEYPWVDNNGSVNCPAHYGFPDFDRVELTKFLALISSLLNISGAMNK
jgi:hypothetical protein